MPYGRVRAFIRMMPRLMAEESLMRAKEVAVATGSLDKSASRDIQGSWSRAARGDRPMRSQKAGVGDLGSLGIGYHVVEAQS